VRRARLASTARYGTLALAGRHAPRRRRVIVKERHFVMGRSTLYTTDYFALRCTDTVGTATSQMLQNRTTDLPVVDANGKFVGMFRIDHIFADLLPKAALIGYGMPDLGFLSSTLDDLRKHMQALENHSVQEYVLKPEQVVHPDTSPLEVVLLLYRGMNNVPVVDPASGMLVGLVSARELLSALHEGP
jgi:CBS-domain-containing membrane protein